MVVFTCNNCGDSLQKPRVAKHYQIQCHRAISLTCVDCFKDFLGDEYVGHTKCITEAERYGSKDYVAKPSANKGEKKQQEWIKIVNNVINGVNNLTKDEKNILQHISKHENIPRKKVKFMNFVKSSMGFRVNMNAVESCWMKIEAASNEIAKNNKSVETEKVNGSTKDDNGENINVNSVENSKENEKIEKKSSKKRKHDELNVDENNIKQQKLKLDDKEIEANNDLSTDKQQVQKEGEEITNSETKFDWQSRILHVLGTKQEVSLRKLEKKVVAKYLKHSNKLTNEQAVARLHKKINKMSELILDGDIVKRRQ
ncbi:hypothetical protein PV327_006320 [Microctonus hyperodae]|uniref:Cell growth-regulating nucleolar protein n=1 Tax=Microctonus hyperodae TaxID=165561 RepID=A0AA39KI92_MICHY|nr:hypothetical protein PV327_006320 [Microctonus hyperodae]